MSRFVLTAQIQLQAPGNSRDVLRQIRRDLGSGRPVSIPIELTGVSRAQTQIRQITRETELASSAAEALGRNFGLAIRRFAAFTVASRAVSLFTNSFANAVDDAIEFQRQMIKISQVTGDSIKQLRGLQNTITNLSTSLGTSSKDLLAVTRIFSQAGIRGRDLEIALSGIAKTTLAPTFEDITATAEGAVAILSQFKGGVRSLEAQLGSINAVAGKFAVESDDLIGAVRRFGGVFKASGGSLEELLALFTSVRATTRESAESIATGLRTIFTRIQRPKTIKFLEELGIKLTDLNGRFVGPFEATQKLGQALEGLTEGDTRFIAIAEELGGFRQIGKVIPLIRQYKLAQDALTTAQEGTNSLAKDSETAQQALAVQITKVKEEFFALVRGISETATFQVFVKTTLSLASAFIKVAEALKPILPLIAAVAAFRFARGLGNFIGGIGAAVSNVQRRSTGGSILAFADGGVVPGSGNRDTVPAMLTPGEFVIRKSSVEQIGAGNLAAMNEGRYNKGGPVPISRLGGLGSKTSITRVDPKTKRKENLGLRSDKYTAPTSESLSFPIPEEEYAKLQGKGKGWEEWLNKNVPALKGTLANEKDPNYPVDFIVRKGPLKGVVDAKDKRFKDDEKERSRKALNYLLDQTFRDKGYQTSSVKSNSIDLRGNAKPLLGGARLTAGSDNIVLPPIYFAYPEVQYENKEGEISSSFSRGQRLRRERRNPKGYNGGGSVKPFWEMTPEEQEEARKRFQAEEDERSIQKSIAKMQSNTWRDEDLRRGRYKGGYKRRYNGGGSVKPFWEMTPEEQEEARRKFQEAEDERAIQRSIAKMQSNTWRDEDLSRGRRRYGGYKRYNTGGFVDITKIREKLAKSQEEGGLAGKESMQQLSSDGRTKKGVGTVSSGTLNDPKALQYAGVFLGPPGIEKSDFKGTVEGDSILKKISEIDQFKKVAETKFTLPKTTNGETVSRSSREYQEALKQFESQKKIIKDLNKKQESKLKGKKFPFSVKAVGVKDEYVNTIENNIIGGLLDIIKFTSTQVAGQLGQKIPDSLDDPATFLKDINVDNMVGNLFEGVIARLGTPFGSGGKDDANAPFDFPQGVPDQFLGIFEDGNKIAGLPTEAKAKYNSNSLESFISKIKNEEAKNKAAEFANLFSEVQIPQVLARGSGASAFTNKAVGGKIVQRFNKGSSGRGVKGFGPHRQPLIDDLKNTPDALLPNPSVAIPTMLSSGSASLDLDRTLFRTIGDQAYMNAKTDEQRSEVIERYFRDPMTRLNDVRTAKLTQFGQQLQQLVKNKEIDPSNLSIISKSADVPGLKDYVSQVFGIPPQNMEFTSGGEKSTALDKNRVYGPASKRKPIKKAAGGGISSSDTVPALLTPGEFVINRKSAEKIGYGNLNRMNKQGVVGFNKGGGVKVQKFSTGTGANGVASSGDQGIEKLIQVINQKITGEKGDQSLQKTRRQNLRELEKSERVLQAETDEKRIKTQDKVTEAKSTNDPLGLKIADLEGKQLARYDIADEEEQKIMSGKLAKLREEYQANATIVREGTEKLSEFDAALEKSIERQGKLVEQYNESIQRSKASIESEKELIKQRGKLTETDSLTREEDEIGLGPSLGGKSTATEKATFFEENEKNSKQPTKPLKAVRGSEFIEEKGLEAFLQKSLEKEQESGGKDLYPVIKDLVTKSTKSDGETVDLNKLINEGNDLAGPIAQLREQAAKARNSSGSNDQIMNNEQRAKTFDTLASKLEELKAERDADCKCANLIVKAIESLQKSVESGGVAVSSPFVEAGVQAAEQNVVSEETAIAAEGARLKETIDKKGIVEAGKTIQSTPGFENTNLGKDLQDALDGVLLDTTSGLIEARNNIEKRIEQLKQYSKDLVSLEMAPDPASSQKINELQSVADSFTGEIKKQNTPEQGNIVNTILGISAASAVLTSSLENFAKTTAETSAAQAFVNDALKNTANAATTLATTLTTVKSAVNSNLIRDRDGNLTGKTKLGESVSGFGQGLEGGRFKIASKPLQNFGGLLNKVGSFLPKVLSGFNVAAIGFTAAGIAATTMAGSFQRAADKAVELGDASSAAENIANAEWWNYINDNFLTFSGLLGQLGTVFSYVGGLFSSSAGNINAFSEASEKATRELNKKIAEGAVQATKNSVDVVLSGLERGGDLDKKGSAGFDEGASKVATNIAEANRRVQNVRSNSKDVGKANELQKKIDEDFQRTVTTFANRGAEDEQIRKLTAAYKDATPEVREAAERFVELTIATREAAKNLVAAKFDTLKITSAFSVAAASTKAFSDGLVTGSNALQGYVDQLNASAGVVGFDATNLINSIESELINSISDAGGGGASDLKQSIARQAAAARGANAFSKNVGSVINNLDLSKLDPGDAKAKIEEALLGAVPDNLDSDVDKAIKANITNAVSKIDPLTGTPADVSETIKTIVEANSQLSSGYSQAAQIQASHNQKITDLYKEREQLEQKAIDSANSAIETQLEAGKIFEQFGGKRLTEDQQLSARIAQFNNVGQAGGLNVGLRTGDASDIRRTSAEIGKKFAESQGKFLSSVRSGESNAFAGSKGVVADKRDEARKADAQLIQFTKQRISLLQEELKIVEAKNKAEQDALDKLIGGDIEGFIADQAAAGAAAALRSGSSDLTSLFSSSALGAGFKTLKDQGLSDQELTKAAAGVLGRVGITDSSSAGILAGVSPEAEAIRAQGRELAGALGDIAQQQVAFDRSEIAINEATITATNLNFNEALSKTAEQNASRGLARGGVVYANKGMFVPRGTDTVPAMLTPGEFVVNRAAVRRGNNMQILRAMNSGGGASAPTHMKGGGQVNYYNTGGMVDAISSAFSNALPQLSNIFSGFSSAVDKLVTSQFSLRLDTTNINVNLNGGSFLEKMKEDVKQDLLDHISREIKSYKLNTSGDLNKDNSVLGK